MNRRYGFSRPGFSQLESKPQLSANEVKSKLRLILRRIREIKKDIDNDVKTLNSKLKSVLSDWDDLNKTNWVKETDNVELEYFYLEYRIRRLTEQDKAKVTESIDNLSNDHGNISDESNLDRKNVEIIVDEPEQADDEEASEDSTEDRSDEENNRIAGDTFNLTEN